TVMQTEGLRVYPAPTPGPQGSFAHWAFSTISLWCSFNRSTNLFQESSWFKGEGPFRAKVYKLLKFIGTCAHIDTEWKSVIPLAAHLAE
ncbi:hypothetical protein KUCAC02_002420, partial [Chaenocephalus aceratus]